MPSLSRRDFVRGGTALVTIGATGNSLLKGALAFAGQNPASVAANKRTLILVQLAGGNDGLSTVVPASDPAYRSVRRQLALAEDAVLPLTGGYGLHPKLAGLKSRWDAGQLAVVHGAGYPNQDYSHFKSMAIWQAGDPELGLDNGWLGRTLEKIESDSHDPFFGLNAGSSTPPELRNPSIAIPSVRDPATYGILRGQTLAPATDPRSATLMKLYEQYPASSPYGVLLETTAESAIASSAALATVHATYKPGVTYPESSFAAGLGVLAEAIVGDLGMRVGHVTLGGFDTHANQQADHDTLMETLDQGLAAFMGDLEAHGKADDVLVLTWSEFGRRVEENGNAGTDHGSASMLFALGKQVEAGLYGEPVSLTKLIDRGNLQYTTDFRSVYATVIERWLGTPSNPLLGGTWPQLGFLKAA